MPSFPIRIAAAALATAAHAASAQSPSAPPARHERELAPVLVLGERDPDAALTVPAALDRIDARELDRARPRLQLSESLQRVPGVVVRDRQNQAQDLQISIRGYGARATFGVRG